MMVDVRRLAMSALLLLNAFVFGGALNLLLVRGLLLANSHRPQVYSLLDELIPFYAVYVLAVLVLAAADFVAGVLLLERWLAPPRRPV